MLNLENFSTKGLLDIIENFDNILNEYQKRITFSDGDILSTDDSVFVYKAIEQDDKAGYYCAIRRGYKGIKFPEENNGAVWTWKQYCRYANGNERQCLFNALKENGYVWNALDNKLIKIENNDERNDN